MTASPLRTKEELLLFCDAYFQGVGAATTFSSDDYREYELPRDVDKELTDRPYYWLWVEQTNEEVPPTTLRLAFTDKAVQRENERLRTIALEKFEAGNPTEVDRMFFRPPTAELVTLGSFRLDKLYDSIDKRGRFACIRPTHWRPGSRAVPWLLGHARISNCCDLTEQELVSVAVCLINGHILPDFYQMVERVDFESAPIDEVMACCKIHPTDGLKQLEQYITQSVMGKSHDWAKVAQKRLEKELGQIRLYYDSLSPESDDEKRIMETERHRKEREMTLRSQPRIEIEWCQLALVCLSERQ